MELQIFHIFSSSYFQLSSIFFLDIRNIVQTITLILCVCMSIYTCGGIALGAGRPAEDQRGAARTSTTAEATAERKCMTLPLAYIFLCRYVKREASSKAAIAHDYEWWQVKPRRAESRASSSIRSVLAIRANSISLSLFLSPFSPLSSFSIRLVFNHAALEVLNFLVRC